MKHRFNHRLCVCVALALVAVWAGQGVVHAADPTNVSGCVFWLRADAGVRTNASGKVTNWVDQVSGIVVTNSGGASPSEPGVTASWENGRPALNWTSKPGYGLVLPAGGLSITNGQDRAIFMVVRISASRGGNNEVFGPGTGWMIDLAGTSNGGSAGSIRLRNGSNNYWVNSAGLASGGSYIVAVVAKAGSPTNVSVYRSGTLVGSTNNFDCSFYTLTNAIGIGWSMFATREYIGHIAEVVLFNRALDTTDHNAVGAYLAEKYAIASAYAGGIQPVNQPGAVVRHSTSAVLGATLLGGDADMWFLWSTNSAPGQTLTAWEGQAKLTNVSSAGATVTCLATNLEPGTKYYWRCFASNATATGWATTTENFTTHSALKAFSPPPVTSGLVLNLDASALSYTNNQRFEWWPDAAGSTADFTANYGAATNWPTYKASVASLSNQPAVRFGKAQPLTGGAIPSIGPGTNRTMFLVVVPASSAGGNSEVIGTSSGTMIDLAGARSGAPANCARIRSTGSVFSRSNSLAMDVPHIVAVTDEGGGVPPTRVYVDGVEAIPYTYDLYLGTSSTNRFFAWNMTSGVGLGWSDVSGREYAGDIAQIVLYNRVLSGPEQNAVGCFLQTKYGLAGAYRSPRGAIFKIR